MYNILEHIYMVHEDLVRPTEVHPLANTHDSLGKSFLLYHYVCMRMKRGDSYVLYVNDCFEWLKRPYRIVPLMLFAFSDVDNIERLVYKAWFEKSFVGLIDYIAKIKPVLVVIDQQNYIYKEHKEDEFPFNLSKQFASYRQLALKLRSNNIFVITSASSNNYRYQSDKDLENWDIFQFNEPFDDPHLKILINLLFSDEGIFDYEDPDVVFSAIKKCTHGIPIYVNELSKAWRRDRQIETHDNVYRYVK